MWKILVADDDFVNRKLVKEALLAHAECDEAADGEEAINLFKSEWNSNRKYDLVLLDIAMPKMDGVEVVKKIRDFENQHNVTLGNGIPIIMITARHMAIAKSYREGCDDVIIKPINIDELLEKAETLIKVWHERQASRPDV